MWIDACSGFVEFHLPHLLWVEVFMTSRSAMNVVQSMQFGLNAAGELLESQLISLFEFEVFGSFTVDDERL